MKIVAGLQVFEEEDFIKPTLRSLLIFCDKIIVVEGCWETTQKVIGGKRSRDKTIEYIKEIMEHEDPHNKIVLKHYNGKDQKAHRLHILDLVFKERCDWFLQGDGDEVFHEDEIPTLIKYMAIPQVKAINPYHKLFWNDLQHYEKWISAGRWFRLSGIKRRQIVYKGCNYFGLKGKPNWYKNPKHCLTPKNIWIYHPSYCKNLSRQIVKWEHRSADGNSKKKFGHSLDKDTGFVYRHGKNGREWYENELRKQDINKLPKFLIGHERCKPFFD